MYCTGASSAFFLKVGTMKEADRSVAKAVYSTKLDSQCIFISKMNVRPLLTRIPGSVLFIVSNQNVSTYFLF